MSEPKDYSQTLAKQELALNNSKLQLTYLLMDLLSGKTAISINNNMGVSTTYRVVRPSGSD